MKIIELKEGEAVSLKRSGLHGSEAEIATVNTIIETVKKEGDQALVDYTQQFDGVELTDLCVTKAELDNAYRHIDQPVLAAIRQAIANVRAFHEQQKAKSWFQTAPDGTILGQRVTPLDAVGVYVPGGKAAYPSSIIMNVVPAQVAGVKDISMVSPSGKNGSLPPAVLATAAELGVHTIYKLGGAQAVAALAYGTETVRPVDKITGPGNKYVALAKRAVFGDVAIDMIAGPSEICVLADEKANPAYVAADLLSQAEHDEDATAVLVTPSRELAEAVQQETARQLATLPRKEIAGRALEQFGALYVTASLAQAIEVVNQLAPEHLEIATEEPLALLGRVKHAGAIFLGSYSAEPVGDYFAGPNHVLPTNGTARFASPLSVDDFVKKSSIISYSKTALAENGKAITELARLEGLEAHARAIDIRLEDM
ncbi:histidinol dehydrogenase [Shouchella clausii]|uniref:histidinol dehydrogenase n=1 Tax=Shouchella TaxID=2893057 RepID=UPI0004E6A3D9|nr:MULTISPECIES: histidinol dehydrogenase [Shouchella]MCM3313544.1 histidinol dehydrogenase [Psychrobacillus sp. MER TA 17]ALA54076.1 Histidinol dehydrogenase [Shouchella clausii]MBU3229371.1 histidinol dehydrogenase [Shouchella clausii]MBU3265407.1 histidinol dehydrogenase [Shouchella clausii]MBU3506271.1 histidinol dehydrogenase [Shouchella clausii]